MLFAAGGSKWRVFALMLLGSLTFAAGCGGGDGGSMSTGTGGAGGTSGSATGGVSGRGGSMATGGTSGQGGASVVSDAGGGTGGVGGGGGSNGAGGSVPPGGVDANGDATEVSVPRPDGNAPDATTTVDAGACSTCTNWGTPTMLGRVSAAGLDALSGMGASWRNSGIVYVHNDRNRAVIYALNETAALVSTITFTGATVQDVEDMAVSRCPSGTCLFLADIGNNITAREEFAIYRATEPAIPATGAPAQQSVPAERFAFRYADGAHNAESLIVDPNGGGVFIVTKVNTGMPSAAYKLMTFTAGQVNVAMKIADLPVPRANDMPAVSGTAHPCGAGFLLRTGNTLYNFPIAAGAPFEQAFQATPVAVPVATEQQGEAVTYRADGRAIFTTSEGTSPPLNRALCQ